MTGRREYVLADISLHGKSNGERKLSMSETERTSRTVISDDAQ